MHTEPPAQRLLRRLGAASEASPSDDASEPESGADHDNDTNPNALLPRWLPDSAARGEAGWVASIRADPGRAGAIALGVVATVAVLVTIITLLRGQPNPVVSAKLPPVEMVSTSSVRTSGPSSAPPDRPVIVSVVGLVQKPGLVTLAPEARIADALSAAGGPATGADTIGLNMARHLVDGEQIVVGMAAALGEPTLLGSSISPASGAKDVPAAAPPGNDARDNGAQHGDAQDGVSAAAPINLNTATVEQLDTLPGVGPVTAAAIVAFRTEHGNFASVDQLGDVDGIGPARLDKLRDLVRI